MMKKGHFGQDPVQVLQWRGPFQEQAGHFFGKVPAHYDAQSKQRTRVTKLKGNVEDSDCKCCKDTDWQISR